MSTVVGILGALLLVWLAIGSAPKRRSTSIESESARRAAREARRLAQQPWDAHERDNR